MVPTHLNHPTSPRAEAEVPLKALPHSGGILQVDDKPIAAYIYEWVHTTLSQMGEGMEEPTGAQQETADPISVTSSLTAFVPRTRDPGHLDGGNPIAGRLIVMGTCVINIEELVRKQG